MTAQRILVIDDNELNLELASFVLRAAGFDVDIATDSGSALALIAAQMPQLALVDLDLPDMDGLALANHLKADATTREVALVAFTATTPADCAGAARAAGFLGCIEKPIDVDTFAATVRTYLIP
jgi:CheY-like chemotaxis protein